MLRGHTAEVVGLELKGTRIISASADSTLRVYPLNIVALLYVHKGCTHLTFPSIALVVEDMECLFEGLHQSAQRTPKICG